MKTFQITLLEFNDLSKENKIRVAKEVLGNEIEEGITEDFIHGQFENIDQWRERNINNTLNKLNEKCNWLFLDDEFQQDINDSFPNLFTPLRSYLKEIK